MQDEVARKLVIGLRQLAAEPGTHSDRINGYATELAAAIGYVEASPDLLAARELAAATFERESESAVDYVSKLRFLLRAQHFRDGKQDEMPLVTDMLAAIRKGRELAQAEQRAEMMASQRLDSTVAHRLTITIDGPQGSGKTLLADHLARSMPWVIRAPYRSDKNRLDPRIIEMRDGRRFDVRAQTFLDPTVASLFA